MPERIVVILKNSHNMTFRVVAVSLIPERIVVVFSTQWAFSIFEHNISQNLNKAVKNHISDKEICMFKTTRSLVQNI